MGYATLDAALALPNNLPPERIHIVITDTLKSDANFLIHHFVGNQLKADRSVILVGLAQIFNHYFLIGRKLGINLQTYKQSGQFSFLDGLTHLNPYSHTTPYPPAKTPSTPNGTLDGSLGTKDVLRSFYQTIKDHLESKKKPLLVLDDVSVLLQSGLGLREVCQFVYKLKSLVESVDGTLVTVCHADEQGSEDIEQDAFVKTVLTSAELVLQVQALGSGLARDVHGQLSILHGSKCMPNTSLNYLGQSLHYKILDNNVHFFAKGISQGVL